MKLSYRFLSFPHIPTLFSNMHMFTSMVRYLRLVLERSEPGPMRNQSIRTWAQQQDVLAVLGISVKGKARHV
jgi:hypothetical protein